MQRNNRFGRYFALFVIAGVLVLGASAAGFYYYQAAGEPEPATTDDDATDDGADGTTEEDGETAIPVNVVGIETGSVSSYITSTANLVPEDEVNVLAEAEGRVARLLVEEGDVVSEGQLLAALVRDEAEILHQQARLKATNAQLGFERGRKMSNQELISREEFDRLTMEHEIAQRELAAAEWKLERTEIRAPFGGRVTARMVTLGQHIRPGDELFTVTDFQPLIARLYLPEKDVLRLNEGREVAITLEAAEDVRFKGRIRQISPVVDTATGTVKVTVEAIRPPAQVRPGGFVTVDIVRETRPDAVLLPREAVVRELQRAHVFVATGAEAEKRAVELGLEEGDYLEAVSGVEPGERVIVAGQGSLKNGSRIKVLADTSAGEQPESRAS